MSQASELIAQQFLNGQVVPADLEGQNAVSKTYVDEQLAIRDQNISNVSSAATTAQADIDNHEASTTAHPAQNITYSGEVTGAANVKAGLDSLKTTIDQLTTSGDSSPAANAARYSTPQDKTYPSLKDRLDASDVYADGRGVNVKQPPYNAKGNGIDDDTAAWQAAINYCAANRIPLIVPGGVYAYVLDDLIIPSYVNIIGMGGNRARIKAKSNAINLFKIQGREISIENLFINMDAATDTSSTAFLFDTSAEYGIYDVRIHNIRVWNAYCSIKDSNNSAVYVNTFIEDVTCVFPKGTQIIVNDSQGFNFFTKVSVDMTFNTSPVTYPAWSLRNTAGVILQDCDSLGHGTGDVYNEFAIGFELINCTAVWFNRVMVDYMGGTGVKITGSDYIYLNDLVCGGGLGEALDIRSSTNIHGASVTAIGSKGKYYEVANKCGVYLQGVNGLNIASIVVRDSTTDGFYFKDCSRLQVGVLQANDNGGYGIKEEQTTIGTSVANIINSAITAGNTGGNAKLVSAYTYIATIMLNSGTAQFQKVGPITV